MNRRLMGFTSAFLLAAAGVALLMHEKKELEVDGPLHETAPRTRVSDSTDDIPTLPTFAVQTKGNVHQLNAIAEEAIAKAQLMESEKSWQRDLPLRQLRELSEEGDTVAMELLAGELSEEQPDEALAYAMAAARGGRPAAAVLAADILATSKHDPAEGLLLLDAFEETHGRSPLVSTVRNRFAHMHAMTEEQILSHYRLLKSNKQRGAPQKYPLTATTEFKAPARPAPP